MPPLIAAIVGVAFAFAFGAAYGAVRRVWRRRHGANLDLTPWYRTGPSVVLEEQESGGRKDHE